MGLKQVFGDAADGAGIGFGEGGEDAFFGDVFVFADLAYVGFEVGWCGLGCFGDISGGVFGCFAFDYVMVIGVCHGRGIGGQGFGFGDFGDEDSVGVVVDFVYHFAFEEGGCAFGDIGEAAGRGGGGEFGELIFITATGETERAEDGWGGVFGKDGHAECLGLPDAGVGVIVFMDADGERDGLGGGLRDGVYHAADIVAAVFCADDIEAV